MEASENGIRKSNETFKRVTLGLLGVFSLFLILFTVNKGLLTGEVGLGEFGRARGGSNGGGGVLPITSGQGGVYGGGGATASYPPVATTGNTNTSSSAAQAIAGDQAVRSALAALPNGGISINRPVCSSPTQTVCTTVGGLPQGTIAMLGNLRSECSGTIIVTGGTEAGHSTHGPGRAPVDLGINNGTFNSCVQSFPTGESLTFCTATYTRYGYTFCNERGTNHWHVCVTGQCYRGN